MPLRGMRLQVRGLKCRCLKCRVLKRQEPEVQGTGVKGPELQAAAMRDISAERLPSAIERQAAAGV